MRNASLRQIGRDTRTAFALVYQPPEGHETPTVAVFIATRNQVAAVLLHGLRMTCGSIAALTWKDTARLRVSATLRHKLRELHRIERLRGAGNPGQPVIRFLHGGSDPVVRTNAIRRVIRTMPDVTSPT